METTPPPNQLQFFLTLLLDHIIKAHVSYDKAFKNIINRYRFSRWLIPVFYKIGYYTVNNYYGLRWLAAKHGYGTKPAGIVSYFLRLGFSVKKLQRILREEAKRLSTSKRISVMYSYPEFLVKDLLQYMNALELEKMLMHLNTRKRWLRINTLKTTIEEALECLDEENIIVSKKSRLEYMLFVEHPKWEPIGRTQCVIKGIVVPQDIASAYVVEAIRPARKKTLVDACSAPGLKLSLAYMLSNNDLLSIAVDKSEKRIHTERKLLERLGINRYMATLIHGDSSKLSFSRVFDYAIIDAPCSGLGAVFSDPAVKINTSRGDKLEYYHTVQVKILENILRYSRRVVYSTCSIHPLEGEAVVEEVVDKGLAELVEPGISLTNAYKGYRLSGKMYRVYPHIENGQGFFIAVLESRVAGK